MQTGPDPPLPGAPCGIEETWFGAADAGARGPAEPGEAAESEAFPNPSDPSTNVQPPARIGAPEKGGQLGQDAEAVEAFALDPEFDYDGVQLSVRPWPWNPEGPGKPSST